MNSQFKAKNVVVEEEALVMGSLRKPKIDLHQNCHIRIHGADGEEWEKSEIIKAVLRSQKRAREAERIGKEMKKEREYVKRALEEESKQLLAYRQWVGLLEIQGRMLHHQCQIHNDEEDAKGEGEGGGKALVLALALALCLGITGVGFAFGYSFFF